MLKRVLTVALLLTTMQPAPAAVPIPKPVPRAVCGPGSIPEPRTQAQGRVTAADLARGRGFRCNLVMIGHEGTYAGFRAHRYIDQAGHECAFYDTTPYLQTRPNKAFLNSDLLGVHVLDMTNPRHPLRTDDLKTPAMAMPHESLSIHHASGLMGADMGNLATMPGFVDFYDVSKDCRHPAMMSSTFLGVLGHEGSFSPDGKTFWVSAGAGAYAEHDVGTLTAIDVSNPRVPRILWTSLKYTVHGLNLSADGNTLYYADLGPDRGLTILDVSEIQARKPLPKVRRISHITWPTSSLPQTPIPVTIKRHPYLVEVDEFTHDTIANFFSNKSMTRPDDMVGAARIIDIKNPAAPRVVSDIRLQVHQPAARTGAQSADPGADTATSYTAHYCAVPRSRDPAIVACGFNLSGLRVFDIRDPFHPKEIAYFNPPTTTGVPYQAMSAPAFVPERNEIWYTDANYGFYVLRVTNGVWRR
ncbi:MAG: hypothetical protein WAT66_11445 [Actinomycetota bacterium]